MHNIDDHWLRFLQKGTCLYFQSWDFAIWSNQWYVSQGEWNFVLGHIFSLGAISPQEDGNFWREGNVWKKNLRDYNDFEVSKGPCCVNRLQYTHGINSSWQVRIREKTSKKAAWGKSMTGAEKQVQKHCYRPHITLVSPSVGYIPSLGRTSLNLMPFFPCVHWVALPVPPLDELS